MVNAHRRHRGPRPQRPHRLRWILIALAIAVIAAATKLIVDFPPERLRAMVGHELSASLAREFRFKDARLWLWPPVRLVISGADLAEPGGFANGTALRLRSLHLDLNPWAILSRRVEVRRLTLDQPALHLVIRGDGSTNFDGLGTGARPSRAAKPMDFAVQAIEVRGGELLVDDLRSARRTAFGLESHLDFASERGGTRMSTRGSTHIAHLAFGSLAATRAAELNQSLAKLDWEIQHRGTFDATSKQLALDRLAFKLGRAELALSGVVDSVGPRPRLDLRTVGREIDLGQLLHFLSDIDAHAIKGIKGGGRLDFDLLVRGPLDAHNIPALAGTLRIKDGAFRYPGAPAGVEGLALTMRIFSDSMVCPRLVGRVAGQPVQAAFDVSHFSDPWLRFKLVGALDLAAVGHLVAPPKTKLQGKAAVDVSGAGRAKDPGSFDLEGRARLADVSVDTPELPTKWERIGGEIEFSRAEARVNGFTARAGHSSFTLDGRLLRPLALMSARAPGKPVVEPAQLEFTLRSPYLDLAEMMRTTGGGLILPYADGAGSVSIAQFKNQKFEAQNVSARLAFEPGIVTVSSFGLDAYRGSLSGRARLVATQPDRPLLTLKADLKSSDAEAVLGTWTGAGNVLHGALGGNIDLSVEGTREDEMKRSLTAAGLAGFSEGILGPLHLLDEIAAFTRIPGYREIHFKDLALPFKVTRGRVATGPTKLTGPNGDWTIAGAIGFDGSLDYVVSITIPPEVVARLGARAALAAGAIADPSGRVLLDLKVTGTPRSPRLAWDREAMQQRLAGRASEALAEQRAKLEQVWRDTLASTRRATEDSARAAAERYRKALEDSLRRRARGVFQNIFGSAKDTTKH